MRMGQKGLEMLKHFEDLRLEAYQDSVGVWTIGYGHIKGVKPGDVMTESQAVDTLVDEIKEYEDYVHQNVSVPLSQDQFDALVDWTYNLGVGNLKASSMLKKLNAGDYDSVPSEMKKWNRAGGKVLRGLKRRRAAEAHLWETGEVNFHPDGWDS